MDESILHLYQISKSLQGKKDSIEISSSQLGDLMNVSQQSASRYLTSLEKQGYIRRARTTKGQVVSLTEKGVSALEELRADLDKFFSSDEKGKGKKSAEGILARGMGEGAYYIREYSGEIRKHLGFDPFPGTFNVKISEDAYDSLDLERTATGTIKGFKKEGRSFGPIKYAQVKIYAKDKEADCYFILPMRTHHRDVLEIISEENLRDKLGVEDDEHVRVEFV